MSGLRRLERISVELVSVLRRLERISVEFVSEFVGRLSTKTHFGHEMASQNAVWAYNLHTMHSFSRGIRFWYSRGLVPDFWDPKISEASWIKKRVNLTEIGVSG